MSEEFSKTYEPKEHEEKIYKLWENAGAFKPKFAEQRGLHADKRGKLRRGQRGSAFSLRKSAFSMVLPPPNVTGILHMGHAAMLAIQDILARYHRMRGAKTLWIPGTDHAAIATQERVEREIYRKENKTRHDLGREEFLKRVEKFAKESHDAIVNQIKSLGASLDWNREAFTLDDERSLAVCTAFKKMYDAGLIYRGERVVNWDPKLQTTVSDDEIEWREERAPFYYLKYGPFTIATARPETKFGDKYVVMHPSDPRYKNYESGQKLEVEWINGKITATIVKDKAVDMKFGTGVMTITPWHDAADFEIAERHKLDKEQIIDLRGRLLPVAGEFAGKKIKEARQEIVKKLMEKGLLVKTDENYVHRVAVSSRGEGMIEPQILKQWFVDVTKDFKLTTSNIKGVKSGSKTTLKEIMMRAVKSGQIEIVPERFKKIYFHWIKNLRDWCISRQIWYGHRLPVWYRQRGSAQISTLASSPSRSGRIDVEIGAEKEIYVGIEPPKGGDWEQDPDTLDTWFSSGLWTFSTLGWPQKTRDLETFHPNSVLETGYDILFFWVARMILMSGFLLGDIPFKKVYLHGMVRDAQGRKMSKSLGNTIDPLEMADKYGADATRLSLIIGAAPGNDIKLSEDKIRGYRNFSTKLWNIARFIAMSDKRELREVKTKFSAQDKKYIKNFSALKKAVTSDIQDFKFHLAGERLYHYVWHTFADKIIEAAKPRLAGSDVKDQAAALAMLREIFFGALKLLHPFMPFVTEAIYQKLFKKDNQLLMTEKW